MGRPKHVMVAMASWEGWFCIPTIGGSPMYGNVYGCFQNQGDGKMDGL